MRHPIKYVQQRVSQWLINKGKMTLFHTTSFHIFTWNILAPNGVLHAFRRLSLPVETNHFPHAANLKLSTQLSCKWSWYLSGLVAWSTSTLEFSIPTASHSPVGQNPNEKICELKSCCCSCLPSRKSQLLTVLSRPPVHSLVPSADISMQEAPSVCPWNCRTRVWLCKSHTAMFPSEQQLKHTFESGLMAKA